MDLLHLELPAKVQPTGKQLRTSSPSADALVDLALFMREQLAQGYHGQQAQDLRAWAASQAVQRGFSEQNARVLVDTACRMANVLSISQGGFAPGATLAPAQRIERMRAAL